MAFWRFFFSSQTCVCVCVCAYSRVSVVVLETGRFLSNTLFTTVYPIIKILEVISLKSIFIYFFGCTRSQLRHVGPLVMAYGLFSCSTWNLIPQPGSNSGLLHWELRLFSTGPPEKSQNVLIRNKNHGLCLGVAHSLIAGKVKQVNGQLPQRFISVKK